MMVPHSGYKILTMRTEFETACSPRSRPEILHLLPSARTPDELSRKLKTPRSTAYRTLVTLRGRHLVERDLHPPRYTLGFGPFAHAPSESRADPTDRARDQRELAASVQETAVLTRGRPALRSKPSSRLTPSALPPAPGEECRFTSAR
jgi:DNA-binding transcriptional ArsR family regulator